MEKSIVLTDKAIMAGLAVLDRCGPPQWRDLINIVSLDTSSPIWCVLGQIFGDYVTGIERLTEMVGSIDHQWTVDHGFDVLRGRHDKLTAAWKESLRPRASSCGGQ